MKPSSLKSTVSDTWVKFKLVYKISFAQIALAKFCFICQNFIYRLVIAN